MGFLLMRNFTSPCFGHLQTIGSLSYADLVKNVDIFYHTVSNITFVNISTNSIRQDFSNFYLKAQILSLATNTDSCFPWSDSLTLFIFEKMSAKHPSLNNQFGSCSFKLKWCFMKKKKRQVIQLATQLHKCLSVFPWENSCTLLCRNICR